MPTELLNVRIVTPKAVVYEGQAFSVSSTNSKGKFDILPQHANFITVIEGYPITIKTVTGSEATITIGKSKTKTLTFNFPIAIISTVKNKVNIYTDISLK